MNTYLKQLIDLINYGNMDNTYKMAWIKSIVEICENNCKEKIHFDEISLLIYKHYWNQTFFFNLNQGSNRNKKPKIIQYVEDGIKQYKNKFNTSQPISFVKHPLAYDLFVPFKKISTILKQDVAWRFLELGKDKYDIYDLDLQNRIISVKKPLLIKEFADPINQIINYRWSQKLEDLDGSPRIIKKIKGVDRDKTPKRKSLKPYRKFLDIENPNKICFLTGEKIQDNDLSIDHVIPWSYMYSDDLWNLVYVSKSANSSKSNIMPDKEIIQKLIKRNKKLLKELIINVYTGKSVDELQLSIDKDFVVHHWTGFKN